MSESEKTKQKVLHARIPESLDRDLKAKAASLGMSVSNLVRHVLTNTLDLVESVIVDSTRVAVSARELVSDVPPSLATPASPAAETIIGWQELHLGINALCDRCNNILPIGTKAAIAVTNGSGPRATRCLPCLSELTAASQEQASPES